MEGKALRKVSLVASEWQLALPAGTFQDLGRLVHELRDELFELTALFSSAAVLGLDVESGAKLPLARLGCGVRRRGGWLGLCLHALS